MNELNKMKSHLSKILRKKGRQNDSKERKEKRRKEKKKRKMESLY